MEDLIKIDRRLLQDVQKALLEQSRKAGIVCKICSEDGIQADCSDCKCCRELAWLEQELWRALQ